MMRFAAIVTAAALATGHALAAEKVRGAYTVNGTNCDGSKYGGHAVIRMTSTQTCLIAWNTGGEANGTCMVDGNIMAAHYSFTEGGQSGLVIYEILRDGRLRGNWTVAGAEGIGTETLIPEK